MSMKSDRYLWYVKTVFGALSTVICKNLLQSSVENTAALPGEYKVDFMGKKGVRVPYG